MWLFLFWSLALSTMAFTTSKNIKCSPSWLKDHTCLIYTDRQQISKIWDTFLMLFQKKMLEIRYGDTSTNSCFPINWLNLFFFKVNFILSFIHTLLALTLRCSANHFSGILLQQQSLYLSACNQWKWDESHLVGKWFLQSENTILLFVWTFCCIRTESRQFYSSHLASGPALHHCRLIISFFNFGGQNLKKIFSLLYFISDYLQKYSIV